MTHKLKPNQLWKSFKADFKNNNGNIKWKLDKWFHEDGTIVACQADAAADAADAEKILDKCEAFILKEILPTLKEIN